MGKSTLIGVIILAAFLFGGVAFSGTTVQTKEVTKEVCSKDADWKALKEIDDRGFVLAGEGFGNVSGMLKAYQEGDYDTVLKLQNDFNGLLSHINAVSDERRGVLVKLGY